MKPVFGCFFRWVSSLTLFVLLLGRNPAASAQTLASQPSYQLTGLRAIIRAQPNSVLLRVRYESNNPGPVYVEFLDNQRRVVYTERKRETHFVGDYDLSPLPAGDYTLHLFTHGFHHVEAVRINRVNNSVATVQVIRPAAFRLSSQLVLPSAVIK